MIATQFTILRADGTEEVRTERMNDKPGYMVLQVLVRPIIGCEYAERVRVLHDGQALDMFVDESGLDKRLPRNVKATAIYRNNVMTQKPDTDPESLPDVVGDAVLFSRSVWNRPHDQ